MREIAATRKADAPRDCLDRDGSGTQWLGRVMQTRLRDEFHWGQRRSYLVRTFARAKAAMLAVLHEEPRFSELFMAYLLDLD
jgi:hypothetical protein